MEQRTNSETAQTVTPIDCAPKTSQTTVSAAATAQQEKRTDNNQALKILAIALILLAVFWLGAILGSMRWGFHGGYFGMHPYHGVFRAHR